MGSHSRRCRVSGCSRRQATPTYIRKVNAWLALCDAHIAQLGWGADLAFKPHRPYSFDSTQGTEDLSLF